MIDETKVLWEMNEMMSTGFRGWFIMYVDHACTDKIIGQTRRSAPTPP